MKKILICWLVGLPVAWLTGLAIGFYYGPYSFPLAVILGLMIGLSSWTFAERVTS